MHMLRFIDQLIGVPVVGVRGGNRLTITAEPVINPSRMRVEAFYCDNRADELDMVLYAEDILEISNIGIVVDSEDSIMPTTDLVRLEEIIEIDFQLIGKNVETESGDKLGKVENYAVDDTSFKIEKLYARPQLIRSLRANDFIISRRQIASVNDKSIVVKDATIAKDKKSHKPSLNPLSG